MGFRVLSKPNHSRILGDRCGCLSSPCTPTSPACELTMPPAGASAAASPAWSSSHLIGAQPAPGNPGTAPGHSTANTPGRIQQRNFTFTQKKKGEKSRGTRAMSTLNQLAPAPSCSQCPTLPGQDISAHFWGDGGLSQPARGAVGSRECQGLCPPFFSQSRHNKAAGFVKCHRACPQPCRRQGNYRSLSPLLLQLG